MKIIAPYAVVQRNRELLAVWRWRPTEAGWAYQAADRNIEGRTEGWREGACV